MTARHATPLLHFRSHYDFLNSLLSPAEIVALATEAGCRAVGLCDPNLHGAMEFVTAAQRAGLHPVLGAVVPVEGRLRSFHVVDATGYANLCRLLSAPGVTEDLLRRHAAGLLESRAAHPVIRYARPADHHALRITQSIRTLTLLERPHPEKLPPGFHCRPVSGADAIREAEDLAARCHFTFETGQLWFPRFTPPGGETAGGFLAGLAEAGLQRRYGESAGRHRERLRTELTLIAEVGYEEYFLSVWSLLEDCRRRGIEWITRGSAADSLVCHCLGISDVCPVRFELCFERFLNRDRMALRKLPDIDVDFPHDRREEVVDLVFARHAPGHAALVGGFHTFQARSALAEIAKVLGMADHEARKLTRHLRAGRVADLPAAVPRTPAAADRLFADHAAREALRLASLLDGRPRNPKMHPCGVVLSRRPIHDFTPTFASPSGRPITHFDMDAVEDAGLVKLDILAQGGLAVLRDAAAMLPDGGADAKAGAEGPWDDEAVWAMVSEGRSRGVHHIESPAMLSLARMCACRDIDTLVAIVSVIRPGAANSLRKTVFARRACGLEPPSYPHPSLEPVLRSTHGVVAYEEHILQICEAFAAMPAGRADILRRALVKDRTADIAAMRGEFVAAAEACGRRPGEIRAVWDLLHGFRGYAFCRAHSAAYALEAYRAARMKSRHPAEFLAAVLTHEKGFYSPLVYTLEARLMGLGLLPPDVNASREHYFPERQADGSIALRVPLWRVQGLSLALRQRLAAPREPFASLAHFHQRAAPERAEMHALVRAGAFDSFGVSRTHAVWKVQHLTRQPAQPEQPALFPATEPAAPDLPPMDPEAARRQRLQDEMELLGFTVSGHPLDLHPGVAWSSYIPVADLQNFSGRTVTFAGLVAASREHRQADGGTMKFLTLCDRTGMVETEMFAAVHRRHGLDTLRYPVLEITGRVEPFPCGSGFSVRVLRAGPPRVTGGQRAARASTNSLRRTGLDR